VTAYQPTPVDLRDQASQQGSMALHRPRVARNAERETIYTVITSFSLCSETSLILVMCWSVSFWI
jgi:hypothetical protein